MICIYFVRKYLKHSNYNVIYKKLNIINDKLKNQEM